LQDHAINRIDMQSAPSLLLPINYARIRNPTPER